MVDQNNQPINTTEFFVQIIGKKVSGSEKTLNYKQEDSESSEDQFDANSEKRFMFVLLSNNTDPTVMFNGNDRNGKQFEWFAIDNMYAFLPNLDPTIAYCNLVLSCD